jgi:hypothetical protein
VSVREFMAAVDARILASPVVRDIMKIGSYEVPGVFFAEPREIPLAGGSVRGVELSFDCRWEKKISQLTEQDLVTIVGFGRYRFLCEVIPGGDASGMTTLELGALAP